MGARNKYFPLWKSNQHLVNGSEETTFGKWPSVDGSIMFKGSSELLTLTIKKL